MSSGLSRTGRPWRKMLMSGAGFRSLWLSPVLMTVSFRCTWDVGSRSEMNSGPPTRRALRGFPSSRKRSVLIGVSFRCTWDDGSYDVTSPRKRFVCVRGSALSHCSPLYSHRCLISLYVGRLIVWWDISCESLIRRPIDTGLGPRRGARPQAGRAFWGTVFRS